MNLTQSIAEKLQSVGLEIRDFAATPHDVMLQVQPSTLLIQDSVWAWIEENGEIRAWWENPHRPSGWAVRRRRRVAAGLLEELQEKVHEEAQWRLVKAEALVREALHEAEVDDSFGFKFRLVTDLPAITSGIMEVRKAVTSLSSLATV